MPPPNEAVGALVHGRYRLIELAGRGSMAEVYRAEQLGAEGFHRPVAVKRILSRFVSSPQYRAMFIREAQLNASLDHPNVVQVLDFGEDNAGLFLVSEWVEGLAMRDINALCQAFGVRGSPVLAAAIGIEVLRALEAAHGHVTRADDGTMQSTPIIHRDISPANVLLSVRGVVKLADFGIARTLDDPGLTPAAALLPKLGYMAPEVVSGQQPSLTADIYSVGVLLWESIAGVKLWQGRSDAEIIMALTHGVRPTPMLTVRPDVPSSIAAAIDHALATGPANRFQTAAAFARALSDALRLIPERTDTTRLAQEVANALNLRKRLAAAQARSQPPAGGASPASVRPVAQAVPVNPPRPPSRRPRDASLDPGTTLELVGAFPPDSPAQENGRDTEPSLAEDVAHIPDPPHDGRDPT